MIASIVGMLIDAPFNSITGQIIDAAIEVHRTFGPGLLESAYLECLQFELADRDLRFERQRVIPLVYKRKPLATSYRADLIVEDTALSK